MLSKKRSFFSVFKELPCIKAIFNLNFSPFGSILGTIVITIGIIAGLMGINYSILCIPGAYEYMCKLLEQEGSKIDISVMMLLYDVFIIPAMIFFGYIFIIIILSVLDDMHPKKNFKKFEERLSNLSFDSFKSLNNVMKEDIHYMSSMHEAGFYTSLAYQKIHQVYIDYFEQCLKENSEDDIFLRLKKCSIKYNNFEFNAIERYALEMCWNDFEDADSCLEKIENDVINVKNNLAAKNIKVTYLYD